MTNILVTRSVIRLVSADTELYVDNQKEDISVLTRETVQKL